MVRPAIAGHFVIGPLCACWPTMVPRQGQIELTGCTKAISPGNDPKFGSCSHEGLDCVSSGIPRPFAERSMISGSSTFLHGSPGHCGPFRHWPSMRLLAHYGPMAGRDRTCRVDQSHLAPTRRSNARLVPYGSVNDGLTGRAGNARIPRPFSECSTSFPRTSAEHSTKSRARASVGTDANGRSKPRNGWRARPCCPLGRMVTVSGVALGVDPASVIVCPQGG